MKKVVSLFLILFFTQSGKAQTCCAPGAEWHYRVYFPFYVNYQDGYMKVSVTGTLNNGSTLFYNLSGTFYGELYPQGSGTTTLNYFNISIYEQNQVVYISPIDTLVNLNASIGDKWRVTRLGTNQSGLPCIRPYLTVVDTGHVLINGQYLKRISVIHSNYPSSSFDIIEKIGCLFGFMYPYYSCEMHGWSLGTFVCYSDNNFPLYQNPGYNLPCNFTTVGKEEFTLEGLELNVFPNPASVNINIEFRGENAPEQFQFIVYDLLGKQVLSQTCSSGNSINLADIKEGLYTLNLISDGTVLARRKLVKAE